MGNNPFLHGVEAGFDGLKEVVTGAYASPTPTIDSRPPTYSPPAKWYPPTRDYDGAYVSYTVHTNVLNTVADTIQAEVPALHQEAGRLRSLASSGALACATQGWKTGNHFGDAMQTAAEGFASAAGQIADIHIAAVRTLAATASTYAEAEDRAYRQFQKEGGGFLQVMPATSHPKTDPVPLTAREINIKPGALPLMGLDAINEEGTTERADVMVWLHGMRPGAYVDLANCLRSLGATLNQAADRIETTVKHLAESWGGTSAVKAFQAFQVMHTQTATLAAQAVQVGKIAQWLGEDVLPPYQALPDPKQIQSGPTLNHGADVITAAENHYLETLNHHLAAAYDAVPSPLVGTSASGSSGADAPPAQVPGRNPFASQKPRDPNGAYLQ